MKNILLPLDFYNDSPSVLSDVIAFLQSNDGKFRIHLLGTYMVPSTSSDQLISIHDELKKGVLATIEKKISQSKLTDDKITFVPVAQMGNPVNVIARVVKEEGIHCVILPKTNKEEVITSLLGKLQCPLVILP